MPRRRDSKDWFELATVVTNDPAASTWLKAALAGAVNRDPVNAAGDAQVLQQICSCGRTLLCKARNRRKGLAKSRSQRPERSMGQRVAMQFCPTYQKHSESKTPRTGK